MNTGVKNDTRVHGRVGYRGFTGVIFDTRVYGPWTRVVCTELYLRRTLLRLYQPLLMMIAQQCNDWYTMAVDRWTVNILVQRERVPRSVSSSLYLTQNADGRCTNRYTCDTYDYDERLKESQDLLRDGVPESCEQAPAHARHLDVEDGEDGAEDAADDTDQHRRREHDHVHWDRASELHTRRRPNFTLASLTRGRTDHVSTKNSTDIDI